MAILHMATISPTKAELIEKLFGGPARIVSSYRFDDPDGEVGVEGFVVAQGPALRHVVLTYRAAPLASADKYFVGMMDHSVLGARWVYNGLGDPVSLGCFHRALLGEQDQPSLDVYDHGELVRTLEPKVQLSVVAIGQTRDDAMMAIRTDLDRPVAETEARRLLARWETGEAVVATLC